MQHANMPVIPPARRAEGPHTAQKALGKRGALHVNPRRAERASRLLPRPLLLLLARHVALVAEGVDADGGDRLGHLASQMPQPTHFLLVHERAVSSPISVPKCNQICISCHYMLL